MQSQTENHVIGRWIPRASFSPSFLPFFVDSHSRTVLNSPSSSPIGHVRYINVLTWIRGVRVKLANFLSFFCPKSGVTANTAQHTHPPTSLSNNSLDMFVPTEAFIKYNTQIFKLSNALYGKPTDSDRKLIYPSKFCEVPNSIASVLDRLINNSSEIKVTIDFCSNSLLSTEYLSLGNFNFEIKKGVPMLIEEQ